MYKHKYAMIVVLLSNQNDFPMKENGMAKYGVSNQT